MTILINGLPLMQIELKRRGLEMKEAFNQIQRYQKHSFWSGQGLFQFVQIFLISNGVGSVDTLIKYYELSVAKKKEGKHKLRIATIFSYTANEVDKDAGGILNDDSEIIGGEGGNPHTRDHDLYDKVKTEHTMEKASILEGVDFELELIHRDLINVQYIVTLLPKLYGAEEKERAAMREALEEKLEASALKSTLSHYERSADLCGRGDSGLGELASNPKHLEDFGS